MSDLIKFGYASGDYTCICHTCRINFDGEKRASTCLSCAKNYHIKELKEFIEDQNRVIRVQVNHDDIMGSATQQLAEAQTKVDKLTAELATIKRAAGYVMRAWDHDRPHLFWSIQQLEKASPDWVDNY